MADKIMALTKSRRFWVAVGGVVLCVFNDGLGLNLDAGQVNHIVLLGGAWIVGDSLRSA
jgi:hypothetical protein